MRPQPPSRILDQTTTTEWRYGLRHLLEVIHPTQRERFEVDARGLRTARIVTLHTPQGELTAVTRYEHDERGQLVALKRQTIQTPWLRWLAQDQIVVQDFQRDLVGLSGYTSGNGIQVRYQRSASGALPSA